MAMTSRKTTQNTNTRFPSLMAGLFIVVWAVFIVEVTIHRHILTEVYDTLCQFKNGITHIQISNALKRQR